MAREGTTSLIAACSANARARTNCLVEVSPYGGSKNNLIVGGMLL